MKPKVFYAHTQGLYPEDQRDSSGLGRLLHVHLQNVASLAETLAKSITTDNRFICVARWAGLLHDIGKYLDAFQHLLMLAVQGLRSKTRVVHSTHGAVVAWNQKAWDVALAVCGHHGGLPDPQRLKERCSQPIDEWDQVLMRASSELESVGFVIPACIPPVAKDLRSESLDLSVRMLLSCLVDADRLDAAGIPYSPRTLSDSSVRLKHLLEYVGRRAAQVPPGTVRDIRQRVLDACLKAAEEPGRLRSLTVPTGGGKTLASMAFGLRKAVLQPHEVHRVIVVIPFLSIIEQNAQVFSQALGADAVLEHHSGEATSTSHPDDSDDENNESHHKLAVENWNAPVVVTTSVRFFESLFSNHPSDLRKLHNIARSVVILDEVQTLPRHLLKALLSMMDGLARDWGTTFVFCTATQPAFEKPDSASEMDVRWPKGTIKEIVPEAQSMFDCLNRITVVWPGKGDMSPRSSWQDLAERLVAEPVVLCILNMRSHAAILYAYLQEREQIDPSRLWHLSTRMCPQHRLDVLRQIRSALDSGGTCRVISTQLVEAGVDVDFPVVFRAMAPLDSIVQAAGRCDREGRLTQRMGRPGGRVVVFEPDVPHKESTPPGAYREATEVTRRMISGVDTLALNQTSLMRAFFNQYYQSDLDPDDIQALRKRLDFPEVAKRFALIEDRTIPVYVPYNQDSVGLIKQFELLRKLDLTLRRRLQRYHVGLYPREFHQALRSGAVYQPVPELDVFCCNPGFYTPELGFRLESDDPWIV